MSKTPLPVAIKQALRSLERRLFVVLFGFGIGRLLRNLTVLVLAVYALDRLLAPPVAVRWVLAGLAVLVLLLRAKRDLFSPLATRPPRRDLAAIWESRNPQLGDRLATAVDMYEQQHSASEPMVEAVTAQAEALCGDLDARAVVPTGRAHRSLLTGTGAMALLLLGVWGFPDEAAIFAQRLSGQDIAWPSDTTLVLLPAYIEGTTDAVAFDHDGAEEYTLAVARGSVISLRIRAEGEVPETVQALGWSRSRPMHALGGGEFVLRMPPLHQDVTLEFRGGDDTDGYPRLHLRAGDAPGLASWTVNTQPPSYTGLPGESGNFQELRALRGTQVSIDFEPNRETTEVEAVFLDGKRQPLTAGEDDQYRFDFMVEASGEVRLSMVGPDGFRNDKAGILKWTATPDRNPEPEVLFPSERWLTVPGGSVPLVVNAMDDFGLSDVTLVRHSDGQEDHAIELNSVQQQTEFRQVLRVPAPDSFSGESFEANRYRFLFSASDAAEPVNNTATVKSPWIEVVPMETEEQRLAERIIALREDLEGLRDRSAGFADDTTAPPSAQQTRRLVRELDSALGEAEGFLLERLYSNLDRQTAALLPVCEQLLGNGRPRPGALTDAISSSTAAAPLDRSGMLLDLCNALRLAQIGPAAEMLLGANQNQSNAVAAANLRDDLDAILEILLSWEDYNSAINLLRDLLERQRGLYLRTREASER
ncbi:MAG: hypothetical protein GY747_14150 [Planctomycetes bacterium]|nr:hypothetical protein [Planctomycetota bacterium]MCP4770603.1 hypothetical protein [Planctomycetota bacterium]MCP4861070.1 hypothetical protein [Planctomycetota bacterium]